MTWSLKTLHSMQCPFDSVHLVRESERMNGLDKLNTVKMKSMMDKEGNLA